MTKPDINKPIEFGDYADFYLSGTSKVNLRKEGDDYFVESIEPMRVEFKERHENDRSS